MDSMLLSDYANDSFHDFPLSYTGHSAEPEAKQEEEEKDHTRIPASYLSGKRTTFLSWEEEQSLVARAREGDEEARKQLVARASCSRRSSACLRACRDLAR